MHVTRHRKKTLDIKHSLLTHTVTKSEADNLMTLSVSGVPKLVGKVGSTKFSECCLEGNSKQKLKVLGRKHKKLNEQLVMVLAFIHQRTASKHRTFRCNKFSSCDFTFPVELLVLFISRSTAANLKPESLEVTRSCDHSSTANSLQRWPYCSQVSRHW